MKTFTGIEEVCASIKFLDWLLAGALACPIVVVTHDALWAGCKPDYFKPPFFIKSMGVCAFDPETLSYAGTPVQQAMCLMRGMDVSRNLLPRLSSLPAPLANRIGQTTRLPSRATAGNHGSGAAIRIVRHRTTRTMPRVRPGAMRHHLRDLHFVRTSPCRGQVSVWSRLAASRSRARRARSGCESVLRSPPVPGSAARCCNPQKNRRAGLSRAGLTTAPRPEQKR